MMAMTTMNMSITMIAGSSGGIVVLIVIYSLLSFDYFQTLACVCVCVCVHVRVCMLMHL